MSKVAYHYTTKYCLDRILADGQINPATEGVPSHEAPVVWFSVEKTWEPTATKGLANEHGRRSATFPEMVRIGIARIAVDCSRLLHWDELRKAANIDTETCDALKRAARKQGGNPQNWYGVVGVFELDDEPRIEMFDAKTNGWVEVSA